MITHLRRPALLALMSLLCFVANALDITQPKKDGIMEAITVGEPINFYDHGGKDGNLSDTYYKTASVFKSANEGETLNVNFTMVNLAETAALYIYDGEITSYYSAPDGYIGKLTGTQTGSFSCASGTMTILYYSEDFDNSAPGWEALIEAVPSKDMEWVSLTSDSALASSAYPGAACVPLMKLDLLTDGGGNPFALTQAAFTLSGGDYLTNVRAVLGRDADSPAGGTQLGDAAEFASTLTFTGNLPLKSKHNYLWLVADVAANAPIGAEFSATCTSVKTGDTERITQTQAGPVCTVAPVVLMGAEPATYTVGETAMTLYDDGGPDGNISANYEGSVTFLPAHEGKRIKIAFEEVKLFDTSSVGYNDELKIYSGQAAEAGNLLASILKQTPTLVSIAADGSLTVTLKSTTGYPKDGFKAVVSEVDPVAMTVTELTGTPVDQNLQAAAGSECDALTLTVKTTGTEPVAKLENVSVKISGTAKAAKVGLKNVDGKTLGSADVTYTGDEGAATITLENVALSQLDDVFTLTVTPAADARNDQTLTVKPDKVNTDIAPAAEAAATLTISNKILLLPGTKEYTISGEWAVETAPYPYTSDYYVYDGTAGERIVVLRPATEGMSISLEFEKFNLSWSSYNAPTFKVYSGTSASGTPLWSCTATTSSTGPGKPLRSQSADGCLTILFDAKGNHGYSFSDHGLIGTATEYKPAPMQLASVEVSQPAAGTAVKSGQTALPILRLATTTTGDLNPLTLDEVKVNLKGAKGQVKSVKLYSTGKKDTFETATLLAEQTPEAEAEHVAFTLSGISLPEKTGYFWVTYDLNDQVPAGLEIDAALASVTIGGSEVSDVITPDPEGFCPTVAIYLFQGGGDVVNVDGSLLFYDDGGEDANYTTEHKGSVTFVPKEGQIISFEFLDFYVNVNDKFTVHDGASTDCTQIANLYSERKDLAPLFSSSPDGCLTVNFSANRPYNRGWAIKVSSIEPVMYTVEKAELTAVADARLLRGSEKAVVACLKIDAQGNRGPVALDKLTFDTTGTTAGTLKGLSVTSSEKLTGYNDTNEIGASETGEIATSAALTFPGSLYLWVRADIAPDAPADAKVQLALSSILSGETEMLAQPTEAVSASLTAGLSGEYTVGTTESDYPTLQAAADALKAGVEGPVTFIIAPGKYTELVRIEEIPGASAANTVTFRSATGNRDDVTLNFEQYSSSYGSTEYGVLTISGADWLTFESLSVTTQQMSFPMLVKVGDHAQHFTMRNCHVYTATGTGYSDPTLVECYVNSDAIPNRNNDYATFENCLFEGGYIGLQLGGTSIVNPKPLPMEVGGLVTGCEFLNQGSKGLYINSESNASILRNYFTADGAQMNSSYYAMDLNRADGDFLIEGNVIELSGIEGQAGIYCRPARGTAEAFPRIINNEIALTGVTGSASGIAVNSESPYLLIANNSIHITGEASGSRCLYLNDKMPEGRIVNNIFDNQAGGYAVRVQKDTYLPVTFTTNMLRTSGTNLAYVAGSDVADLAAWNSAVTDETAFTVADLAFLADNILEPADFTPLAKGTPLPEVTADIAGVARAEQTPTVGAYEATDTSVTPAAAEGYPAVDSVTHESARLSMQANCHGVAQVLVLTADAEAPSVETLAASESVLELRKGRAAALTLTGLKPNTEYKAWVLLTCLRGQVGEPLASEIFMTSYKPTEVATFEDVTLAEGVSTFDDGTAHFESFLVQEDETAPVAGSRKVAVMEDTESVITLTNASNLVIDGFWLRNEASLTIEAIRADAATAAETAEATSADTKTLEPAAWRYVNLRDLGEIAGIRLATAGAAAIDDFAGAPAPLEAAVTGGDTRINAGTEVTLTAAVSGGVAPFTYRWTNSLQQELGTGAELKVTPEVTGQYQLTVTDAWGNAATAGTRLDVTGEMKIATFDDLYLAEDSYWYGDKNNPDYTSGTFLSGSFEFNNYYMAEYDAWAWFGYANIKGTEFHDYHDQMVCAAGSGHDSDNYGVAYMSDYNGPCTMSFTNTEGTQQIPGLWLTSNAYLKDAVLNGDGMSGPFTQGDWCAVRISGLKADDSYTEPIEVKLADYTAEDARDHYCLNTWQWFSLAQLGEVKGLRFQFTSTKTNSWGITTPAYACIDDLGDVCPVVEKEAVELPDDLRTLDLAPYFSFDADEATVTYTLLSGEATLTGAEAAVTCPQFATTSLVVKATQKGCSEWVEIPVTVGESGVNILPADEVLKYEVFTTAGVKVYEGTELPNLDSGIYLIVRHTARGAFRTMERR